MHIFMKFTKLEDGAWLSNVNKAATEIYLKKDRLMEEC